MLKKNRFPWFVSAWLLALGLPVSGVGAQLHIAILGDGFFNYATYDYYVRILETAILNQSPFKDRASEIVFHELSSYNGLNCYSTGPQDVSCPTQPLSNILAGTTNATAIVIRNDPSYGGGVFNGVFSNPWDRTTYSGGYAVANIDTSETPSRFIDTALHDLGHVFGLLDMYVLENTTGPIDNQSHKNCIAANFDDLATLNRLAPLGPNEQYYLGCFYSNWVGVGLIHWQLSGGLQGFNSLGTMGTLMGWWSWPFNDKYDSHSVSYLNQSITQSENSCTLTPWTSSDPNFVNLYFSAPNAATMTPSTDNGSPLTVWGYGSQIENGRTLPVASSSTSIYAWIPNLPQGQTKITVRVNTGGYCSIVITNYGGTVYLSPGGNG